MTDLFNIDLQDVMDAEFISQIKDSCESQFPNPLNIYCSVSGALIGKLNDHAIWQLILSFPANTHNDFKSVIEELRQSCMLAMRPSPAWVHQSPQRLKHMVQRDPVGSCVYFLTRAYHQNNRPALASDSNCNGGINWQRWESKHAQAEFNWERVQLAEFLRVNISQTTLKQLALLLCEVDGLQGLQTLPTPSKFLDNLLSESKMKKLYSHYNRIKNKLLDNASKRGKTTGNTASRTAFNYIRPDSNKPSARQQQLAKKQKQQSELTQIWQDIMNIDTIDKAIENRETLAKGQLPTAKPMPVTELKNRSLIPQGAKLQLKPKGV